MKISKIATSIFVSFIIFSFCAMAQAQTPEPEKVDSVTNEELKKVAETLQQAREIGREANQKVQQLVKKTEMEIQRFQTIMRSKSNPQADTLSLTEEEKEIMQEIRPKMAEINRQSKQKLNEAIKENGLTRQRLEQVMLVLQTKPEVAQRFQKIVGEQNGIQ